MQISYVCLAAIGVCLLTTAGAPLVGEATAQAIPTTAHIQVTGALRQQRSGYGRFHFQAPRLLVLWVSASTGPILSLQLRRSGASFLGAGRYEVIPGGEDGRPPTDSTLFQVYVQHEGRFSATYSGYVSIEKADTLKVSGHLSLRSLHLADSTGSLPRDTIRIRAQFTAAYEPFIVELRGYLNGRPEPHPPAPRFLRKEKIHKPPEPL